MRNRPRFCVVGVHIGSPSAQPEGFWQYTVGVSTSKTQCTKETFDKPSPPVRKDGQSVVVGAEFSHQVMQRTKHSRSCRDQQIAVRRSTVQTFDSSTGFSRHQSGGRVVP
jgi:hypothetical protein